jgi:D-xylose transport system substrate-binding protein
LYSVSKRVGLTAVAGSAALIIAACGSSGGGSAAPSASSTGSASASVPSVSATDFTNDFSVMAKLKPLAAEGKGGVGVILPDTTTSARYTEFDAPYLTKALTAAGLTSSQFSVQNAQGSDATQLSLAQADITKGDSVLIMDPLDSGVGKSIEKYAAAHGAVVIDYDRLTLGGSRKYYVSFDNVKVGKLIGDGLVSCIADWKVKNPNVLVMRGDPTDNNATLFAQGYDAVLAPHFSSGWKNVGKTAGTWDPPTALTEFQQQFTAHPNINALLSPNDENAAPIIHYLQTKGVKKNTFPVTGQDATLVGLQNILAGYQCGTAYKPIYLEAEAAAALAMYLRAHQTPPATLVNGTTNDTKASPVLPVPAVLLTPKWVTTANMESTVIADKFVKVAQLCVGTYATLCKTYGIS